SRRRHTRSKRDWSSDVCSSDLVEVPPGDEGDVGIYSIGESDIVRTTVAGYEVGVSNAESMTDEGTGTTYEEGDMRIRASTIADKIGRASCRERVEGGERAGAGG